MEDADLTAPGPSAATRTSLGSDGPSFAFEQAVRLLELDRGTRGPVGGFVDPTDEVVRFSVPPTLASPPAPIRELTAPGKDGGSADGPWEMAVAHFGLVGPAGVLPREYTSLVAQRVRARDRALADFLDLFQHRSVSLLYRAWRRGRIDVQREAGEADLLGRRLLDMVGFLPEETPGDRGPEEAELATYAGLLGAQPRSAAALEQWLEGIFRVQVRVEPFAGAWYPIPEAERSHLDAGDETILLGEGAVVGDELWDAQARVRLRVGPLPLERYRDFLPGGPAHARLRTLCRFFSHDQVDFELQLVLDGETLPSPHLHDEAEAPLRLGWETWLPAATPRAELDDTLLLL
jgi:type VI secretion system protein ImpH